jgi:hypothetical protein
VEKVNALIFTAIKKILENQPKGKWAEELPRVVWSHNTSICRATKFTPFKLLYGEEPVTPEEIVIPRSKKAEAKPPYVCRGCLNHTYSNNMINRCHV